MGDRLTLSAELTNEPSDAGALETFVRSALYSGLQSPANGVAQLVDKIAGSKILSHIQLIDSPAEASFGTKEWHAQQLGSAGGMIPWFIALHKGGAALISKALGRVEAAAASSVAAVATESGAKDGIRFLSRKTGVEVAASTLSGFAYGAVFTPVHESENFLAGRSCNALSSAMTFATLSASMRALESRRLSNRAFNGMAAGVPAGLVSAESHSLLSGKGFAGGTDVTESMYGFVVVGGAFGLVDSKLQARKDVARSDRPLATEVDWRCQPMPELSSSKTALDYHQIPVEINGSMNRQKLVDVGSYGIAASSAYARDIAPYYRSFPTALDRVYVREAVAEKLAQANHRLRSYGVELLALDGYRPIELQRELWDHFIQKGREVLTNPTEKDLEKFAGQFCSDPRGFDPHDFRTWPVHNTGGAIDLTLRSIRDKQELFMGSIFDDADVISASRHFEKADGASQSAIEAQRNRRLLFHAMKEVGFANYHHEWWHFDYGTQMWVMNGGHCGPALYGRAAAAPASRSGLSLDAATRFLRGRRS